MSENSSNQNNERLLRILDKVILNEEIYKNLKFCIKTCIEDKGFDFSPENSLFHGRTKHNMFSFDITFYPSISDIKEVKIVRTLDPSEENNMGQTKNYIEFIGSEIIQLTEYHFGRTSETTERLIYLNNELAYSKTTEYCIDHRNKKERTILEEVYRSSDKSAVNRIWAIENGIVSTPVYSEATVFDSDPYNTKEIEGHVCTTDRISDSLSPCISNMSFCKEKKFSQGREHIDEKVKKLIKQNYEKA